MITKFNDYIKEGVRDLMTPKSDEDVRQAYIRLVKSLKNCSMDKFPHEVQIEFQQIADLFGVPKDNLYLIEEEGCVDYDTFEDFFENIVDPSNKVIIEGVKNEDGDSSGEWICYPKQKLAKWSDNDFNNPGVWIFPNNFFSDKLYESIRDKMTPKPTEDIVKNLKNMNPVLYNKYKKDLDVDIPDDSQPLIYQIWKDMKERFPHHTGKLHLRDLGSFGRNMEFDSIIRYKNSPSIDKRTIYVSHSEVMDEVMFKVYPFKKIRKLKDLIVANNYMLENIEQYNEMIEELVKDEKPLDKIKSFFKFNESIRDLMTPKSREDILSNLKGDTSVIFKPSTEEIDDNWTCRIGSIDVSYNDLVELFGEPNAEVDNYKSSTAWELKDNKGRFVFINDYKSTRLYDNDQELPTVEEFRKLPSYGWHVSGARKHQETLLNDLTTFVILNIM